MFLYLLYSIIKSSIEFMVWTYKTAVSLPSTIYSYISFGGQETAQDIILERRLKIADNYHSWFAIATEIDR